MDALDENVLRGDATPVEHRTVVCDLLCQSSPLELP
jgi:hypothetical protein